MSKILSFINSYQRYFSSHILLFHSTFALIPDKIRQNLHNVKPKELLSEVFWLKKYFDIVPLDDYFSNPSPGKAVITFDDAYLSVFNEIIPSFISSEIPCTVFVNGVSMNNKMFWRDKIRYLINNRLEEEFIEFANNKNCNLQSVSRNNFYKITKSPLINSNEIDKILDDFFFKKGFKSENMIYCINDKNKLINNKYITYGNHSFNHYVLSSLNEKEQEAEIAENHNLLHSLNVGCSEIFSVPFGGKFHFNHTTVEILKKYGYKGLLFSRNLINLDYKISAQKNEFCFKERYMAPESFSRFQFFIFKIFIKTFVRTVIQTPFFDSD